MIRWFAALALVALLAGCRAPALLEAVEAQWSVIGPEYRAYVQADPDLDPQSKEIRIQSADILDMVIKKEKERWQ